MNQAAWVKAAQGIVMFLAALGIKVTDADATTVVAGAFGVLSILSAIKAWMSKKQSGLIEPTNEINRLKIKGLKADVNESLANERVAKIRLAKYEAKYGAKKAE